MGDETSAIDPDGAKLVCSVSFISCFPYNYTGDIQIDVLVLSTTATSVDISWTQPAFSAPFQYSVSMTRLSNQMLCGGEAITTESAPVTNTEADSISMTFSGLQEFSAYTATVSVRQGGFLSEPLTLGSVNFTTLSAGMCVSSECFGEGERIWVWGGS